MKHGTAWHLIHRAALAGLIGLVAACGPAPSDTPETRSAETTPEADAGPAAAAPDTEGDSVSDTPAKATAASQTDDPFLWLEEVESETALDWVRARNDETLSVLEADPRFPGYLEAAETIITATDRIPYGAYRAGHVYNFWQDATHVRGLWRRTTLESYKTDTPDWDVILDFDALAEAEGENWVFKGANCLAPDYSRCLVTLSRGGTDAAVIREFDIETRSFIEDGFVLPESKGSADWLDADTLLVGRDWGEGTLTTSGYPRIVKLWRRGTPVEDAPVLFEGDVEDVSAVGYTIERPEGSVTMIEQAFSFFDANRFVLGEDGDLTPLPIPSHVEIEGLFAGQMLVMPQKDWAVGDVTYGPGALLSFDFAAFRETGALPPLVPVLIPDERRSIQQVATTQSAVIVSVLDNVTAAMIRLRFADGAWEATDLPVPDNGTASIASANPFNDTVFVSYENYLTPDTLYAADIAALSLEPLKSLPARFDTDGLVTQQWEATSADGTKVPYFIVHKEGIALDGTNPTLLYGYGGFRIAMTPGYSGTTGKLWLENGGVYVVANIRGGDEFGPAWHSAALKENRQRAYDDFTAVAEDLIARGVTAPDHLGIYGGSNGGLLVGVAFTQRPDLYNAVICAVPLLDMLRYHTLLAGASWMGEYGNPDIPEERAYIAAYSPYQNLDPDADYPRVFFVTSTKDDRVHPGHARKMAARMMEQGHDIHYFERIEGGHSAAANLLQTAHRLALQFVYLDRQLRDGGE